jgi:hypothetical protein
VPIPTAPADPDHWRDADSKGLVARILHRGGSRSKAEFVEVNGAAIPDQLLESELFGYEPGPTPTPAAEGGLLQVAHRGVLFLDEVRGPPRAERPSFTALSSADQLCHLNCCGLRADSWEIMTLTSAGPLKAIASCKALFRSFGFSMNQPLPPNASIILS